MMETAPPAPFIITKAEFLLELLVVALDPPPQLCQIDQTIEDGIFGQGGKPILDRLGFSPGHSIRSHSSARNSLSKLSRCPTGQARGLKAHGRTLRRTKREESQSVVPSSQVIVCHASRGRLRESVLTEIGWCCPRCSRVCGRPRPVRDRGGMGASPGGHTEVVGPIPAT